MAVWCRWQALANALRTNGIDATDHGLRTSLRRWFLECSGASPAVADARIAHALGTSIERAYARLESDRCTQLALRSAARQESSTEQEAENAMYSSPTCVRLALWRS